MEAGREEAAGYGDVAAAGTAADWRTRAAGTKRHRSRQAVLAAAARLFTEYQYRHTSIDAIAAEAHVGVGTIYNHFHGKPDIAASLWRPLYDRLRELVEADIAANVDPASAVRSHLLAFTRTAVDNFELTFALTDAMQESLPAGTVDVVREAVPLPTLLRRLIEYGRGDGSFCEGPPSADLAAALASGHLLRIVNHPEQTPEYTADLFTTIVLGALGQHPHRRPAGE